MEVKPLTGRLVLRGSPALLLPGRLITVSDDDLLARLRPEDRARLRIDQMLGECGWVVQHGKNTNIYAGRGVAIREFALAPGHGRVDYLCYVDGKAAGTIEAKPEGFTLIRRAADRQYVGGLPRISHLG